MRALEAQQAWVHIEPKISVHVRAVERLEGDTDY
jgi:hypothetical protein